MQTGIGEHQARTNNNMWIYVGMRVKGSEGHTETTARAAFFFDSGAVFSQAGRSRKAILQHKFASCF